MTSPTPVVDSPRRERREFIRAMHEHLWRFTGTDRPTVRPQTIVTIVAVTLVCALVCGVITHLIHPRPTDKVASPPPVVTAPSSYQAMTGWDCAPAEDRGFEIGGRTAAWYTVASGGWRGDGCLGSFEVVPMITTARNTGPNQFALWWFKPSNSYDTCDLLVYVPTATDATARAVTYHVLAGAGTGGTSIGLFVIDQASSRGRWVSVGLYPSGPAGLALRLDNSDPGSDHLAVAQVKIHCGEEPGGAG